MASRELPDRPDLDHLRRQAKWLRRAFTEAEPEAVARVQAVLGARTELKLTEAQRVVAREYGFPSWARLRAHVQAARGGEDAFLDAVAAGDAARASEVVRAEPGLTASLHVAAVLGLEDEVRRLLAEDSGEVAVRRGRPPGDPLLWLCHSPFHGERSEGLAGAARALLEAGADPNTRDGGEYGLPALYAVTGLRSAPRVARLLLEAGADPNDGESVHHAAESFREEALELLLEFGVDLNRTGDWGNTPLYFLLRYWDLGEGPPSLRQGLEWLLAHGADPNVRCGPERESSLHVAARRGQPTEIVRRLLEHDAAVDARRGDGRTAWALARRGGFTEVAALLEEAGAAPAPLAPVDELLAACGRGDAEAARRLAGPELGTEELRLLPEAAAHGRPEVVRACLAAGFPVDMRDENGAAALHHAAIRGDAETVLELLRAGADLTLRDPQHDAAPLDWSTFGSDHVARPGGDYAGCVRALLEAGGRPRPNEPPPAHAGVREVLGEYAER
jgi:ankyrin repeat protein